MNESNLTVHYSESKQSSTEITTARRENSNHSNQILQLHDMQSNIRPKTELEFFHPATLSWTRLTENQPSILFKILASTHTDRCALSGPVDETERFSSTLLLFYEPGYRTPGDSSIRHTYKEEVMLLTGRLYDQRLQKWFGKDEYACRDVNMEHGPYLADEKDGCLMIVWIGRD
ncbi:unnamed protein product [Rotaria magnacalcarata]